MPGDFGEHSVLLGSQGWGSIANTFRYEVAVNPAQFMQLLSHVMYDWQTEENAWSIKLNRSDNIFPS